MDKLVVLLELGKAASSNRQHAMSPSPFRFGNIANLVQISCLLFATKQENSLSGQIHGDTTCPAINLENKKTFCLAPSCQARTAEVAKRRLASSQ